MPSSAHPLPLPSIEFVLAAGENPASGGPCPVRPMSVRAMLQRAFKKQVPRPVRVEEHMATVDYRRVEQPQQSLPQVELLEIPVIVVDDYDAQKDNIQVSAGGATVGRPQVRSRPSKVFVKRFCGLMITLRCPFRAAKTVEQTENDLNFDILT